MCVGAILFLESKAIRQKVHTLFGDLFFLKSAPQMSSSHVGLCLTVVKFLKYKITYILV